jgi:colicin import membrane protein
VTADRAIEFAPPPQRLQPGAVALAVAAHLLLLGALTWGVNWKQQADIPTVEAELWSALPRQAAPAPVEPPPPPPAPAPAPAPRPAPAPPPKPDAQAERDADIAVEREKKRRDQEQQRLKLEEQRKDKEREEAAREKREADAKKRKEREAREEAERKEAAADKAEALKKQQAADAKKKSEAAEAAKREAQRQENLKRMAGLAGATGGPTATGDAQRSSGPSGSYGGRVAAKVKPNIVFTEDVAGNPVAEVEVRAAPDGTITGVRLTKSSGNKGWDDAVVRALQKTETLPRDTDGRVPSPIVIGFRPRDVGL